MQRFLWVLAVFLVLALQLPASPCVSGDTLANYVLLGATGCTIGPQTVNNFSFSVASMSGTVTPVSDTNILVTTVFGSDFYGLQFSSTGFTTGSGTVEYLLGYTWDSIPIRGLGDDLDPPTNVSIPTTVCEGATLPSCSGGTLTSVTADPTHLTPTVFFSQTGILGISNDIQLAANASFGSIENDGYVIPEPASMFLTWLGLTILLRKAFTAKGA